MTKHLADHRAAPQGARLQHFLRIARDRSDSVWRGLFQRDLSRQDGNRRMVEFVRIERQHQD